MANQFVNIPVPTANGSGAAVDVSTFGASKTISLCGPFVAFVTIEVSNELVPTVWAPLFTFGTPDGIVRDVACRWMRATVTAYKSGTPACDVGGDDSGATFATLVATAGNGNGAAVDVSALPLFTTIIVGGTYRGNVQIEVSEDGVSNWSQIGFGFPQAGLQSQDITAHYMRVVRSGVPLIAPGLPIIEIAACAGGGGGGGGGGAVTQYTWRPGSGLDGPNVWEDFTELYDALAAARTTANESGEYTIIFDDTDGTEALDMPAGTYDMVGVSWTGVNGRKPANTPYVQLLNGVHITNLLSITGLSIAQGFSSFTPSIQLGSDALYLYGASLIGGEVAQLCTIITDPELGGDATIVMDDFSAITTGSGAASILVPENAELTVLMTGDATIGDAAFQQTDPNTIFVNIESSAASYSTVQPGASPTVTQEIPDWQLAVDPNGLINADTGARLFNRSNANWWVNQGGTVWYLQEGGRQTFRYVATGAEANPFPVAFASPRPHTSYNVQCTMGGPAANAIKEARPLVASFLTTGFDLELSAAAQAGDIFMFTVQDFA